MHECNLLNAIFAHWCCTASGVTRAEGCLSALLREQVAEVLDDERRKLPLGKPFNLLSRCLAA